MRNKIERGSQKQKNGMFSVFSKACGLRSEQHGALCCTVHLSGRIQKTHFENWSKTRIAFLLQRYPETPVANLWEMG